MLREISWTEKDENPVILLPVEYPTKRKIRTDKINKTKQMDTDNGGGGS